MTLEEEIKKEEHIAWAKAEDKKPFEYIDRIYHNHKINTEYQTFIDGVLDIYNYYQKAGIVSNTVFYTLRTVGTTVLNKKYGKLK